MNEGYTPNNEESAKAELALSPTQSQESDARYAEQLRESLTPEEQELLEKCDLKFIGPIGTSEIGTIKGTIEDGSKIFIDRHYKSTFGKDFQLYAEVTAPDGTMKYLLEDEAMPLYKKYDKIARIQSLG